MAGDPTNLLPYRWQPGQSGNPGGWSANRRAARRLRQALDAILADGVPDWLVERLPPELVADLPPGITFAELIALRLVFAGATAKTPQATLEAARLIIATQAKADPLEPRTATRPPKLPATEERRRAVAEQLGVELDEPAGERPPDVH